MIGRLCGRIIEKAPPYLLLDVHGVGYEIESPMSTFYKLPLSTNENVVLFTHLVVRDDAHLLFGFASLSERSLFRALIKVNGVGAKMALTILSGMGTEEFSLCILAEDVGALTRLPGIGKKTAERLIIEMKDKLPGDAAPDLQSVGNAPVKGFSGTALSTESSQAQAALTALGYKPAEATKMVAAVKDDGLSTEEIIRQALQATIKQ